MNVCTIGGCYRKVHARGWCHNHYWRWLTYGDPTFVPEKVTRSLICVCSPHLADPTVKFGECQRCYRKPLALMAAS